MEGGCGLFHSTASCDQSNMATFWNPENEGNSHTETTPCTQADEKLQTEQQV